MYFENKEVDPRDCMYRPSPKIRKQIEQVIRTHKIKYDLLKTDKQVEDDVQKSPGKVKNRFRSSKQTGKADDNNDNKENESDPLLESRFSREKMVSFVEQLDSMLTEEDEQKQSFSYESLVKMHQYLQYLEEDAERDQSEPKKKSSSGTSFRNEFFFQFMESNFRVVAPEKRKDAVLDERLRKLKYQAANSDYDNMTANVGKAIRGGFKSGSSASSKFTLSQELRNVRSTLVATGNAIMVIVATFAFFYIAIGYAQSDITTANRVLFSFAASMVVAVAEIYFLIRII